MDSLINMAQSSICSGSVQDLLQGNTIEKWPLPFLYSDAFYSTVQDTQLDWDTSIWATSLDIWDATDLATSGKLWINGNLVTYTGKTWDELTGVTWILFAHASGARASQLFTLPTDYHTPVRMNYDGQYDLLPKDYRNLYKQLDQYKDQWGYGENKDMFSLNIAPFYTVIQWTYFIPFQIDYSGKMLRLLYEKKATKMTAWTDLFTIPESYADIVPYLAVWEFLYNRWEEWRALELLKFAYWKIREMYTYYNNTNSEDIYNTRITTGKDQIWNI
jgi:hypothetical protein